MKLHKIYTILLLFGSFLPVTGQISSIEKLKQNLPSIADSVRYVDALNRISILFYEQNIDSTLHYSIRARDIARRMGYNKGIADATNNLGIVFDIKGNLQLALRYYNDAYNQYVALDDSSNFVQTLMNIATVYGISGKHDRAVHNFKRALALGSVIAHDSINAMVIYNYILMYPDSLSQSEKTGYFEKATKIASKYRDVRIQLALQQLLANQMIANQKREAGIDLLKKTLSQTTDLKLFYLSMDLFIDLGGLLMDKDPATAIDYYKQGMALSEQKGYRMYTLELSKRLSDYYSRKNDRASAYFYNQKLVTLYQEQLEIDKISGIDYIDFAVKDQQLVSSRMQSDYNSRMLWLALAVCFLTVLSIVFLWRNWMLTRKTHDVLKIQFGQLESTMQALESSNENYARIIKIVAHDLRNPIGGIHSVSSMLLEENNDIHEVRELTQLIQSSSDSCLKLIGDLLKTDFNVRESELNRENIDLSLFLQQAVKLLTFRAKEKNQELILKDEAKSTIFADRDKFLRVINNLVINAIKFSPEKGHIQITSLRSPKGITISVKDNGVGIPKEFTDKIFDPFTSFKRAGTAGEQPFGLGLYISKQIIEAHQGKIWFESEAGQGTTFYLLIPAGKIPFLEAHASSKNVS